MSAAPEFDQYAESYDAELNAALSASGESKEYFAQGRVQWLARCLRQLPDNSESAIDYGCGTGDTLVLLKELLQLRTVVGLDVSVRSLDIAKLRHSSQDRQFFTFEEYVPQSSVDLVYCNGVFHHIPVAERPSAVAYIRRCLRPKGLFALWENNPWNPGTRYVMSHCAFDRDAITLRPLQAARLLQNGGFEIIGVHYQFFFPGFLKPLRFLEPSLARVPLGGQYQILGRKSL